MMYNWGVYIYIYHIYYVSNRCLANSVILFISLCKVFKQQAHPTLLTARKPMTKHQKR